MSRFERLFSPVTAGRLSLSNRLAMLPHGTAMVRDGVITDDDIAYVAARASGLGLVITGASVVAPTSTLRVRNLIEAWDEAGRDMLRKRCDAVHAAGAKIIGQILHLGRETTGGETDFAPMAPSPVRSPRDPFPPHEMTAAEIETVIDYFVRSAVNFLAAGYDGIELHAAHGYLIAQFLSPATNQRTDAWGGTPEKRVRFLRTIVERTREECGDAFAFGVRLSADEQVAGGLTVRDTVAIGQAMAALGMVDYLNITVGMRGAYVKDATHPPAVAAPAASVVRKEVGLPVILGQKILTPEKAEALLAEGAADIIGMARALIADPDWAKKAAAGESERIRPCAGLNQDCRAFAPHIHCAVNPVVGRERRPGFGAFDRVMLPRRVAVLGGGPAGLEAARVAALRGHDVTLFEAGDSLGGQFLLASSLPRRAQLRDTIDHLVREVRHASVRIEMNARIPSMADLPRGFDDILLAMGAQPVPLAPDLASASVLSWWDVLTLGAPAPTGDGTALFVDDGTGFWFSYGVAEMLAEAGWRVTFATTSVAIAAGIPHESVEPLLVRLGRAGTTFRVLTAVHVEAGGEATLVDVVSGHETPMKTDLVVMQTGRRPATLPGLEEGLGASVQLIGDCVTPRRIGHAMLDGHTVARRL